MFPLTLHPRKLGYHPYSNGIAKLPTVKEEIHITQLPFCTTRILTDLTSITRTMAEILKISLTAKKGHESLICGGFIFLKSYHGDYIGNADCSSYNTKNQKPLTLDVFDCLKFWHVLCISPLDGSTLRDCPRNVTSYFWYVEIFHEATTTTKQK